MIKVVNFYAQGIGAHEIFICFNVEGLADPLSRYTFDLYRSSDYQKWIKLASLVNTMHYFDDVALPTANWTLQFKLDVIDNQGKEPVQHVPYIEINTNSNDLIGRELARKYSLVLKRKSGSKANYFMTLKGSIRCSRCSSEVLGVATSSSCSICHGTGYVKALHPPIPTYVQFSNRTKKLDKSIPLADTSPGFLIMANYPLAYPNDIVHEFGRNRFWSIETVNSLEHGGYVYGQQLRATQMDQTHEMVDAIHKYESELDVIAESKRYTGGKTL